MKIILVGGGSGGHITPLLAVAHELKQLRPDVQLVYVGEKGGKFGYVAQESSLFDELYVISAGKFRRYPGNLLKKALDLPTNARNARDALRFARGSIEAGRLLKRLKPDGVFIKGGFVGVPVGKAAARLGIPYITHDSDTLPGLANRLIAKAAAVNATGMPAEFYAYPKHKVAFVGVPVAPQFQPLSAEDRAKFRRELKMDKFSEVITVVGGSQGAVRMNGFITAILPDLLSEFPKLGLIQIAGKANQERVDHEYNQLLTPGERERVMVKGYIDDVYRHSGAADLIITRAGATNMAEFAAQHQACIVIPSGELANDHQTKNARNLADQQAARVLYEPDLQADVHLLKKAIVELLTDKNKRQMLGQNLARLGKPNAAMELAGLLISTFEKRAS